MRLCLCMRPPARAGSSQAHWPFPSKQVAQGYAYILTHPGMPCVFWEHYFDWGSDMRREIDALIKVRRRRGLQGCCLCRRARCVVCRVCRVLLRASRAPRQHA